MPNYRFNLPVRAIGGYRLPEAGVTANVISLNPAAPPSYTARIEPVPADDAEKAYAEAQRMAEQFFAYLALLGEDAGFILDGREGVRARNIDREQNPIPQEQPPPPFESIGGVITEAGQQLFGQIVDPDGSRRRGGAILIHNAQGVLIPGSERLNELCNLFQNRAAVSPRLRTALDIMHDAACAREFTSGFTQTHTALEVLSAPLQPPIVLDAFYKTAQEANTIDQLQHKNKKALLAAARQFFLGASLSEDQTERVVNYSATAQSISQACVFHQYLTSLGLNDVTEKEMADIRTLRGKLVHAADASADDINAMRRFRHLVREALLTELRQAAAPPAAPPNA